MTCTNTTPDLVASLRIDDVAGEELQPSWNVAPTQRVRIVTGRQDGRVMETARWGLVPVWAKDRSVASRAINARSETVLEKPTFRSAAVKRRALVPAEGYYEWQKDGTRKIPTYLHPADGQDVLAFAGLYEFWRDKDIPEGEPGEWLMTTAILTRPAADTLGHIHDRMPIVVPPGLQDDWLDPGTTAKDDVRTLLEAIPDPDLTPRTVGAAVGNVRNNGPELITPA